MISSEQLAELIQTTTIAGIQLVVPVWVLVTSVFISFAILRSLVFYIKKML